MGDLDEKTRAKVARRIGLTVQSAISVFATIKALEIVEIPKECYCKCPESN